jgi:hypothetical protein
MRSAPRTTHYIGGALVRIPDVGKSENTPWPIYDLSAAAVEAPRQRYQRNVRGDGEGESHGGGMSPALTAAAYSAAAHALWNEATRLLRWS